MSFSQNGGATTRPCNVGMCNQDGPQPGPPVFSGTVGGSLSQDGSVVLNAEAGELESTTRQGPTADLIESDAVSGRLLWSIPLGPASALQNGGCVVLWASANGRDLLTQCGTRQLSITDGKARVIQLAWIFPAANGSSAAGISSGDGPSGFQQSTFYSASLTANFAW